MLAAAVHSGERLFMEQAYQSMLCRYFLHDFHGKLVVIGGNIGGGINRSQFMLGGSHLVMLCFCKNAQLPQFLIQVFHISFYTGINEAEIMIIHLLSFRRRRSEKRTSGKHQVRSFHI